MAREADIYNNISVQTLEGIIERMLLRNDTKEKWGGYFGTSISTHQPQGNRNVGEILH